LGKKNISDDNDPEYWNRMAEIIGNPVPEFEDDSDEVDENGVYRGKSLGVATSFDNRVSILSELHGEWAFYEMLRHTGGFPQRAGKGYHWDRVSHEVITHLGMFLAKALERGYISKSKQVEALISECFDLFLSELGVTDRDFKDLTELLM
jgi:hypothetical protein